MNKTILVAGGAGFIGSHLCARFVKEHNNVLCLDDLSTGASENIAHLKNYPNFTLIEHDITKPFDYFIDEIYNLACPASPVKYQADPVKTIETCVFGTTNCLRLAKKYGAKILQASTSEVYGDPKQHPQKEDYWGNVNPIGIRACYDEGKRAAEALCSSYKQQYYVDVKIARLFNCYGPNMAKNDGRVISNFIVQALKNSDITIFGDGSQTRSFCYIDDMLDALVKFMNTDIMGPVNIGNIHTDTVDGKGNRAKARRHAGEKDHAYTLKTLFTENRKENRCDFFEIRLVGNERTSFKKVVFFHKINRPAQTENGAYDRADCRAGDTHGRNRPHAEDQDEIHDDIHYISQNICLHDDCRLAEAKLDCLEKEGE